MLSKGALGALIYADVIVCIILAVAVIAASEMQERHQEPATDVFVPQGSTPPGISTDWAGNELRMKIALPGDILFETGTSELSETAKKHILLLANHISSLPFQKEPTGIRIEGHASELPFIDFEGKDENMSLSIDRANSVYDELIKLQAQFPRIINPLNISVAGYSFYQKKSEKQHGKNQRVELVFYWDKPYSND